jgi:hypothetical protein
MTLHKRVTAEEFVTVYNTADSLAEVIEKTGLTHNATIARAGFYRRKKIPLQRFTKKKSVDFDKLAKLAAELLARGNGRRKD